LRKFKEAANSTMDIGRLCGHQITEESLKDPNEKSIPVQHFIIDFRPILLANKIRVDLDDTPNCTLIDFTKYDLHYMIYRLVRIYGNKIEQQDTVRAIIDYEFHSST
jgi:hypothetical protein